MDAPLLLALRDALVTDGHAVVRFNFRGIGSSEGFPGDGTAEVADAHGAIDAARERYPGLTPALLGWSFGASVAIRVAPDAGELSAVVAITPPVSGRAGFSVGLPQDFASNIPLLVLAGANDTTTDPQKQRAWAEANRARFIALKGANHFFWGKYDDLAAEVTAFLNENL